MSLILPLQKPSTDVNTGNVEISAMLLMLFMHSKNFTGGQFKDATGRSGKSGGEVEWKKLGCLVVVGQSGS